MSSFDVALQGRIGATSALPSRCDVRLSHCGEKKFGNSSDVAWIVACTSFFGHFLAVPRAPPHPLRRLSRAAPHAHTEMAGTLQQQAQEAWARVAPHLQQVRGLAARAATALTAAALQQGDRVVQHLRTADSSTLATYSAAAGMLVLLANHLGQPQRALPRRRLFLAANAVKHAMGNGADVLADRGIGVSDHVLVACQAMEAVEIMSYCNLLRAETFFIDGREQSSAVAFALRVRPSLFVYDSDVVAPQSVHAIATALQNAGCTCSMVAVQEAAVPSHAQYHTVFHKAMTSSARTEIRSPELAAGNGTSPNGRYSLFDTPGRPPASKGFESAQRSLAYDTSTSYATKPKKDATKRDSDLFTELGSAVVGLFGQKKTDDKTTRLEKALHGDSQFDHEFDQRYQKSHDGGSGLLSL